MCTIMGHFCSKLEICTGGSLLYEKRQLAPERESILAILTTLAHKLTAKKMALENNPRTFLSIFSFFHA